MALIVETGAGLADAESYISVADATAYHAARGNSAWAALASDTVREQLLRKATDYMEQRYGQAWKGQRVFSAQALSWPRVYVVANDFEVAGDIVPQAVKNACMELALKASSGELLSDVTAVAKREKVGPIEVENFEGQSQNVRYQAVDGMLAAYLGSGVGSMIRVVRA